MEIITTKDTPVAGRFAYEYRNQWTRGWVRAKFDSQPVDWDAAQDFARQCKSQWQAGTEIRAVEIAESEKFSEVL